MRAGERGARAGGEGGARTEWGARAGRGRGDTGKGGTEIKETKRPDLGGERGRGKGREKAGGEGKREGKKGERGILKEIARPESGRQRREGTMRSKGKRRK